LYKEEDFQMEVKLQGKKEVVVIQAEDHTFKSGTEGFYFRGRVEIDGQSYHVQLIISRNK